MENSSNANCNTKTFEDEGIQGIDINQGGIQYTTCPKCSAGRKKSRNKVLRVNTDRGSWKCYHCLWWGNLGWLKGKRPKEWPTPAKKTYTVPLGNFGPLNAEAIEFLERRKITPEAWERNKIATKKVYFHELEGFANAIAFPYYRGDKLINVKYRSVVGKHFVMEKGAELCLYGVNDIQQELTYLVEGEPDKLALASVGTHNVVSVPNGWSTSANVGDISALRFLDNDEDTIESVKKWRIAVDNDEAGLLLRDAIIARFGRDKCDVVCWPEGCKDANDVLMRHGAEQLLACINAAEEPPVIKAEPVGKKPQSQSKTLTELNKEFAVIRGNQFLILRERQGKIDLLKLSDLRSFLANKPPVKVSEDETLSQANYWLTRPGRREYEGIEFAPGCGREGYYNLWRGFAVEPKDGDPTLFLDHVESVICAGDIVSSEYLLDLLAQLVQEPHKKPGVATVMRGPEGKGKGLLMQFIAKIIGRDAFRHLSSSKQLTGNFNGHLLGVLVAFLDEAFFAGDRSSAGTLKRVITEPTIAIEHKGRDVFEVDNHIHWFMASNENWVVPAGIDSRRFFVVDTFSGDLSRDYYKDLVSFLESDGPSIVFNYLLNRDITQRNLREIPVTQSLIEQRILSLRGPERFWFERLAQPSWVNIVQKQALYEEYVVWANSRHERVEPDALVAKVIRRLCEPSRQERPWSKGEGPRPRLWRFPDHEQARRAFEQAIGAPVEWDAFLNVDVDSD